MFSELPQRLLHLIGSDILPIHFRKVVRQDAANDLRFLVALLASQRLLQGAEQVHVRAGRGALGPILLNGAKLLRLELLPVIGNVPKPEARGATLQALLVLNKGKGRGIIRFEQDIGKHLVR